MRLKILCLNVWHGGKLREALVEFNRPAFYKTHPWLGRRL